MIPEHWVAERQGAFRQAFGGFGPDPLRVLGHHDADGLSATALFVRALGRAGRPAQPRILGRGENPWSAEMAAELRGQPTGGLVVADLGIRAGAVRPDTPTVLVDHHVPAGVPEAATVISGHGLDPTPTSSLLAYWCAGAVAPADDLLWLAALGIIGDLEEKSGFAEMAEARSRYGVTVLRDAVSLLNAPRRAASGDATPALALLLKAEGPREILSGEHPETALLLAAKEEVKQAMEEARRLPPRIAGEVAIIRIHSPCQIHPLIAQAWKGRLKDKIVIAANTGYRPGWVHFAARSGTGVDLIEFLRERAPAGADENYGNGHAQATGGALRAEGWNSFVSGLGYGAEMQVAA
ncbi:hypothetical protein [Roseomonas sp. BN140053]|uniref:hypothetical protein n=1 Tax=Roseomonas sp. BN140053 TaxID=3391898 RepID=UPI0039EB2FE6